MLQLAEIKCYVKEVQQTKKPGVNKAVAHIFLLFLLETTSATFI